MRSGSLALVTLLLEQSADPNCQQYAGSAALHLAAADGREDMVRVLLDAGARLDVFEDYHISPVFTAAQHGQASCLEMLLKHAETKGMARWGASVHAHDTWFIWVLENLESLGI